MAEVNDLAVAARQDFHEPQSLKPCAVHTLNNVFCRNVDPDFLQQQQQQPQPQQPAAAHGYEELVDTFRRRGCAVLPGVLGAAAVEECRAGLHADLMALGIDHNAIVAAAAGMCKEGGAMETGRNGGGGGSAAVAPVLSEVTVRMLRRAQAHATGAIPLPFSSWRLKVFVAHTIMHTRATSCALRTSNHAVERACHTTFCHSHASSYTLLLFRFLSLTYSTSIILC